MVSDLTDPPDSNRQPTAYETGCDLDGIWALVPDSDERPAPDLAIEGPSGAQASGYRVADMAASSVGAATAAAWSHGLIRGLEPGPPPTFATDHALAAWRAPVTIDGRSIPTWAELSGLYETADKRFVQLHCNFPHHAAGVAERLGVPEERARVAEAIADWNAFDLEEVLRLDGMICAAYRSLDEWSAHPHAEACAGLPLIDIERLGEGEPRRPGRPTVPDRPMQGVKVLDCSRVLAGPVCGRTMAAHGADVLRVGAAHLPSVEMGVVATGFGKRNANIDLDTAEGRATFGRLLETADVFVDAYRPGALADRGFSAEEAVRLNPGIVVIEICAFDWVGPWAARRGFDSIIQSTTGIALGQSELVGSDKPVHLPVQALDFATGYLAAFAGTRLLSEQHRVGGSWRARLSLLRTRNWMVGAGGPHPFDPDLTIDVDPFLHTVDSPFGSVTAVRPVVGRWELPPSPLGTSEPRWQ